MSLLERSAEEQMNDLFTDIRAVLAQGREVIIEATGWSMTPLIWDRRDALVLAPLRTDTIRVGNVVLIHYKSRRYIVHRIVAIDGDRLLLRGDGNPRQQEIAYRREVLGELVAIRRAGRMITKESWLWKLFRDYWPSHPLMRKLLIGLYRRIWIRRSFVTK